MPEWEFVKDRTAAQGAVWRSPGGRYFKRTGGPGVSAEAEHQTFLAGLGFPVPRPCETGAEGERHYFFVEPSAGHQTLHEAAMEQAATDGGRVGDALVDRAATVSARLLRAQAQSPLPTGRHPLRSWFMGAGFVDNVFDENPDLDTPRVHSLVDEAVDRLADVPTCHGHLDYGLPNAFDGVVIDWQHHAPAPLGYDVYPMLDITAFKGGGRGYAFSPTQRARYIEALDDAAEDCLGTVLSPHLGDFLLVKCFFFLAFMRPDPEQSNNLKKHRKWLYRRKLFALGTEWYERFQRIDTGDFPEIDSFTADRNPSGT